MIVNKAKILLLLTVKGHAILGNSCFFFFLKLYTKLHFLLCLCSHEVGTQVFWEHSL